MCKIGYLVQVCTKFHLTIHTMTGERNAKYVVVLVLTDGTCPGHYNQGTIHIIENPNTMVTVAPWTLV